MQLMVVDVNSAGSSIVTAPTLVLASLQSVRSLGLGKRACALGLPYRGTESSCAVLCTCGARAPSNPLAGLEVDNPCADLLTPQVQVNLTL